MILGDLLQQCYNIAAPLIVGQFLVHRRRDGASERHCLPLSGRAMCISQRP